MNKNEKYFLNSLLSVAPRCAFLPSVVGAYNKGYTVQPSARASPKFFFHFVPEKLRISLTLSKIPLRSIANNVVRIYPLFYFIPLRGTPYNSGYPKFLFANPPGFASRNFGSSAPHYRK